MWQIGAKYIIQVSQIVKRNQESDKILFRLKMLTKFPNKNKVGLKSLALIGYRSVGDVIK